MRPVLRAPRYSLVVDVDPMGAGQRTFLRKWNMEFVYMPVGGISLPT